MKQVCGLGHANDKPKRYANSSTLDFRFHSELETEGRAQRFTERHGHFRVPGHISSTLQFWVETMQKSGFRQETGNTL